MKMLRENDEKTGWKIHKLIVLEFPDVGIDICPNVSPVWPVPTH